MTRGFTLIELLIVVAIIAILAAIAVPNFIEAQVRARVSRVNADMRAVATALEAYNVDNNNYPRIFAADGSYAIGGSRYRTFNHYMWVRNQHCASGLTTPVAYITAIPGPDPFRVQGTDVNLYGVTTAHAFHFINVLAAAKDRQAYGVSGPSNDQNDIQWHPNLTAPAPVHIIGPDGPMRNVNYAMMSVGPDRSHGPSWPLGTLNLGTWGPPNDYAGWIAGRSVPYDPSNGSTSDGDIWRFSD